MIELEQALAQVERAWREKRDPSAIDRIAAAHPRYQAEIYEFAAALADGASDESLPIEVEKRAGRRARELLSTATYAERTPSTFAGFLLDRTGAEPEEVAEAVGDVNWEFLALISRHPAIVPEPVRDELAARLERAFTLPAAEIRQRIADSRPARRAASRRAAFPLPPVSFEELLKRTSLNRKQREWWRRVARR